MKLTKKLEFWLLILWNIPATLLSYVWGQNYIVSLLFFMGIPAFYLSFKNPLSIKKIGLVSIATTIPVVVILGYLAHINGAWYNVGALNIRLFETYPIEDFLWGFVYFYYTISVYEYFFEKERVYSIQKKLKIFSKSTILISVIFSTLLITLGRNIEIPYIYLWYVIILFILGPLIIFYRHRKIFVKAIYTGLFFIPLNLSYEYVSYINKSWGFPGEDFVGWVSFLGSTFPLEEFVWLLICAPAIIAYYEIIGDDRH